MTMTDNEILDQQEQQERRKGRLWRAIMFYSFLVVLVLGMLLVIHSAIRPLEDWLEQYQAMKSIRTEEDIYDLLLADPDWEKLYDMAGIESTKFEGRAAFCASMEAKIGNDPLTYAEIPTGIADYRLFQIYCKDEQIGAFTMVPQETDEYNVTHWTLGKIELSCHRNQSVSVILLPGQTAYVNNIPLDDSYTVRTVRTLAEEYLEEAYPLPRYLQQTVDGLLAAPTVTVLDAQNRPVPLTQDPESGVYSVPLPTSDTMTGAEHDRILAAAQAEARFCLQKINITQLRQHFGSASQAYTDLLAMEKPKAESYVLTDDSITISHFYRYSPDFYTAYVQIDLEYTDSDGQSQTLQTAVTYFFRPNSVGKAMVVRRVEADLQQPIQQVRLTYQQGQSVLETVMADTRSTELTPPAVEGALGWGKLETDGSLTTVLQLQEDGVFHLVEGQQLEPMTLYPILEE